MAAYQDPQTAITERQKRRNMERNRKWNARFELMEVRFKTLNLDGAKAMMNTLIDEFTLTPSLRMNDETRERFNRLHLNLAAFIEHLTLGLLALKNMEEYEIERVLDFGFRRNDFFACAHIQVKWK